jgi:hypothetical protein
MKSIDALTEQLCPTCGLCCNGVIFANLALQPDDDTARLRSLGLPVSKPSSARRPPRLPQPCAAFDGCRCRVYAERPRYCREFECHLLKGVKAGRTEPATALRIIRTAVQKADRVRSLLQALGDTDEQRPLSARFRRTSKRLQECRLEKEAAATYTQLGLAFHELTLLLSDSFYPGSKRHEAKRGLAKTASVVAAVAMLLFAGTICVPADQVELQNGDRYVGHVLSLNTNTVVLESEVLGTLRLPRKRVAVITLGPVHATNSPALLSPRDAQLLAPPAGSANATSQTSPALAGLGTSTNLIQQVQKQFLGSAGPEANAKFTELLGGLMSGKLDVEDIRAQAKSATEQLRALQRESGESAGVAANAYMAILDSFLKETAPPGSSATNAPAPSTRAKPTPAPERE